MTVATDLPTSETTTPPPSTGSNGAGEATAKLADDQVIRGMKRLEQIENIGRQIEAKKQEVAEQETAVAEAESGLKSERGKLNQKVRERDELQEELDILSLNKHSERLPFGESAQPTKPGKGRDISADLQTRFNAATLEDLGIKGAVREKLEADGIRCGAELQRWFADHPPRQIRGIGQSARDKLNEAMASWFESHQEPVTAAAPVQDAKGKPKRFKGNKKLRTKRAK